jgi:pilus assembly protein Flp/PilA
MSKFKRLLASEEGATAVEYGLIVSLICISALVAIDNVSESTINMWNQVANKVSENDTDGTR